MTNPPFFPPSFPLSLFFSPSPLPSLTFQGIQNCGFHLDPEHLLLTHLTVTLEPSSNWSLSAVADSCPLHSPAGLPESRDNASARISSWVTFSAHEKLPPYPQSWSGYSISFRKIKMNKKHGEIPRKADRCILGQLDKGIIILSPKLLKVHGEKCERQSGTSLAKDD